MDTYTPLFNELLKPLMRLSINGTQFRIILWTARNSYGWSKSRATQFSWSSIAKDIKTSRTAVSREGRELLKQNILIINENGEIGINKRKIKELDGVCETAQVCENAQCETVSTSIRSTVSTSIRPTVSTSIRSFPIGKKDLKKDLKKGRIAETVPPKIEDVRAYCQERGGVIDADDFFDKNEARGWMIGKTRIKSWQATVRTWERNKKTWEAEKQAEKQKKATTWNL
jgi:phage replication O-like protein O